MERTPIPTGLTDTDRIPEAAPPQEVDHITEGLMQLESLGMDPQAARRIGSYVIHVDERCSGSVAEAYARHQTVRDGMTGAIAAAIRNNADPEAAAASSLGFFLKRDPETHEPVLADLTENFKKNRHPSEA